jgi:hypothetical protein
MFYRLKNNKIYDYADYEYAKECLFTNICTMSSFEKNRDFYTVENGKISIVSNPEEVLEQKRKKEFEGSFFETSLGWIRRKVTMKDNSVKDFLADLLLPIKAGMELGQDVEIITYKLPDFTKEPTEEYMKSLQENKFATPVFIQECLYQTVKDFRGTEEGENNGI